MLLVLGGRLTTEEDKMALSNATLPTSGLECSPAHRRRDVVDDRQHVSETTGVGWVRWGRKGTRSRALHMGYSCRVHSVALFVVDEGCLRLAYLVWKQTRSLHARPAWCIPTKYHEGRWCRFLLFCCSTLFTWFDILSHSSTPANNLYGMFSLRSSAEVGILIFSSRPIFVSS